jgi:hypothetical protein
VVRIPGLMPLSIVPQTIPSNQFGCFRGGEIMWRVSSILNQSPQYQAWSVSLGPRKAAG